MRLLLSAALVLLMLGACSQTEKPAPANQTLDIQTFASSAWPALALLKTGEFPLWFELGADGPFHIENPVSAALLPYTPWPHARFVTAIQRWGNSLVMTVNRDGFLILSADAASTKSTDLVLYRVAESSLWDSYTAASSFLLEGKPAVLLYRNDFFSGPAMPLSASQVYVLHSSSPIPQPASIPAFEKLPEGWEAEVLRLEPDGFWYYRAKEKASNDTAYFRARDLAAAGEEISVEEWRNSDSRNTVSDTGSFPLPPLPEGFAYHSIELLGNILLAAWEEQLDAGIGAAGFMVMVLSP